MYNPTDVELVKDRERSRVACGRFNTQAFTGSSIQETERCFRLIMDPETSPPAMAYRGRPERVGRNIRVEAPFRCEYGYNLRIGDNVTIDSGCVFKDAREIYVGDNTRIGPNVTVCGDSTPQAFRYRSYSRAYVIKIGQNVFIGAGVTIAPSEHSMGGNKNELTIGDYAYISAGTVVTAVRTTKLDFVLCTGSWLTKCRMSLAT
jgi:acetyltransferase-like isoleucine patch superfamily enzyme